jgi:hypothetical protein
MGNTNPINVHVNILLFEVRALSQSKLWGFVWLISNYMNLMSICDPVLTRSQNALHQIEMFTKTF